MNTIIAKHKVTYGLIFVENIKIIKNLPTNINQNIKFVDVESWKVYEHYKINGDEIMDQLGFLTDNLKYVTILNSSFVERKDYTSHKATRLKGFSPLAQPDSIS